MICTLQLKTCAAPSSRVEAKSRKKKKPEDEGSLVLAPEMYSFYDSQDM